MKEETREADIEISFIVAVYNIEKYIDECIKAICTIKRKDIEIILVDDGSTDSSLDICKEHAQKDMRIVLISQENKGLPSARNSGLNKAKGRWVVFIDGDDYIAHNFEEKIIPKMDESVDIIIFGYGIVKNGQVQREWNGNDYYLGENDINDIRMGLLNRYCDEYKRHHNPNILFSATWGKFYKRKWLIDNKLDFVPQASWGEDVIFSFKTYSYSKKIKVIGNTGYLYRINELSMTQKYDNDVFNKYLRFMKEMKKLVLNENDELLLTMFYEMVVKQYLTILRRNIFNANNPYSLVKRRKLFLETKRNELVQEGFKKANVLKFNFVINIGAVLAKYNFFLSLDVLYRVQRRLENVRS